MDASSQSGSVSLLDLGNNFQGPGDLSRHNLAKLPYRPHCDLLSYRHGDVKRENVRSATGHQQDDMMEKHTNE